MCLQKSAKVNAAAIKEGRCQVLSANVAQLPFAYTAHWWTDTEGSLAAAVEEMRPGYDQLMIPVIDNIPVLVVVIVLAIPVAILAMRWAEKDFEETGGIIEIEDTLPQNSLISVILREDIDKGLCGFFLIDTFQEMVATQHPAFRVIDGDGGEALDVLDGFPGKDGKERAGSYQIQDSVNTVVFQTDVKLYIVSEKDGFKHIPRLQPFEGKRDVAPS